jgi:UDP-GlcNAc:undecaprenyl-phosphate GlcNAc-1-phosphate transferase
MWIALQMTLSALVSAAMLSILFPRAASLGLVDHPTGERKHHDAPVPVIGGVAIFSAILLVSLVAWPISKPLAFGLAGAAVLVFVGIIDDQRGLRASVRFAAQAAAVSLLSLGGGVKLTSLGDLLGFGPIDLGVLSIPVTVFAMVGIINAFNMIDGIDGLAGGLTLIAILGLLLLAPSIGPPQVLLLIDNLQLLACRRRRVFLGDSGSMLLGYLVVWGLVDAATTDHGITPVTALWLVALPLMDTLRVILRRVRRGRSPFAADSGHLHHMLSSVLGSTRWALVVMLALGSGLAAAGIVAHEYGLQERIIFVAAILVFLSYIVLTHLARRWAEQIAARSADQKGAAEQMRQVPGLSPD